MDYLIEDHFSAFLAFLELAQKRRLKEAVLYPHKHYQVSFLSDFERVEYSETEALKQLSWLEDYHPKLLEMLHLAFLSEDHQRFKDLYNFYQHYLEKGSSVTEDYGHPLVYPVLAMRKKVLREHHKFTGLLRFRPLEKEIYYAAFEPTYDLVPIIGDHFRQRLGALSFIIHDKKREKALFHHGGELRQAPLAQDTPLSTMEDDMEDLWVRYHEHISIESRKNLRLQKHFVPKKYWKYLPEF